MKRLVLGAVLLATLACGSSAEPTYYALAPVNGAGRAGAPRLVKLRRPGLVGYLDRSDVVAKVADYKLKVQTTERWGEPLGDMIGRVLAQDLTQRFPQSTIFFEGGSLSASPDAIVETDIQRFDVGPDGMVTLVAQVAVQLKGDHPQTKSQNITLTRKPNGEGTRAMVAAMSELLGDLADRVSQMFV